MAKQTNKPAQAATETTGELPFVFRAVLRATLDDGRRVRRVRNFDVLPDAFDAAEMLAESVHVEMRKAAQAEGADMASVYVATLPPSGYKVRGGVSRGFGIAADGSVQWVSRTHKAGDPVPAEKATA